MYLHVHGVLQVQGEIDLYLFIIFLLITYSMYTQTAVWGVHVHTSI